MAPKCYYIPLSAVWSCAQIPINGESVFLGGSCALIDSEFTLSPRWTQLKTGIRKFSGFSEVEADVAILVTSPIDCRLVYKSQLKYKGNTTQPLHIKACAWGFHVYTSRLYMKQPANRPQFTKRQVHWILSPTFPPFFPVSCNV